LRQRGASEAGALAIGAARHGGGRSTAARHAESAAAAATCSAATAPAVGVLLLRWGMHQLLKQFLLLKSNQPRLQFRLRLL